MISEEHYNLKMSAEEQQTQEIEALQAIFQPDEFEALEAEYPNISVQFILSSNQVCRCEDRSKPVAQIRLSGEIHKKVYSVAINSL